MVSNSGTSQNPFVQRDLDEPEGLGNADICPYATKINTTLHLGRSSANTGWAMTGEQLCWEGRGGGDRQQAGHGPAKRAPCRQLYSAAPGCDRNSACHGDTGRRTRADRAGAPRGGPYFVSRAGRRRPP